MTETPNPYESPAGSSGSSDDSLELLPISKEVVAEDDIHKQGMICLMLATVSVVAIECLFYEVGFCLLFGPPILFFALAFWSVFVGSSNGTRPVWLRIVLGLVAAVLAVPCFQFLLMVTCISANDSIRGNWQSGGGGRSGLMYAIVSGGFIALFAFMLFFLAYLLPTHVRASKEPPEVDPAKS